MTAILGLNAYHADLAACLVRDGKLIAAGEEERFRRIKHWAGLPVGELILRTAFVILLVIVTVLTLYPHLQLPEPSALQGYFDKIGHVLAFVALAVLGANAWPRRWSLIGGLACYAVILELSQRFSPGREVHIADALANLVGLAIGFGLVVAGRRIRARARTKSTPPMATG